MGNFILVEVLLPASGKTSGELWLNVLKKCNPSFLAILMLADVFLLPESRSYQSQKTKYTTVQDLTDFSASWSTFLKTILWRFVGLRYVTPTRKI